MQSHDHNAMRRPIGSGSVSGMGGVITPPQLTSVTPSVMAAARRPSPTHSPKPGSIPGSRPAAPISPMARPQQPARQTAKPIAPGAPGRKPDASTIKTASYPPVLPTAPQRPVTRAPAMAPAKIPSASSSRIQAVTPASARQSTRVAVPLRLNSSDSARSTKTTACTRCGLALSAIALQRGDAVAIGGQTICIACAKGGKNIKLKEFNQRTLMIAGGASAAVLLVATFVAPILAVVLALPLGILGISCGALSLALPRRVRVTACGAGIALTALGVYALLSIQDGHQQARVQAEINARVQQTTELLRAGAIIEARSLIGDVQDHLSARNSAVTPQAASEIVARLNALSDAWIAEKYGRLDEPDMKMLLQLLARFGSRAGNGVARIPVFKKSDHTLRLSLATSAPAADLRDLVVYIAQKFPAVESLEIKLVQPAVSFDEILTFTADKLGTDAIKRGDLHAVVQATLRASTSNK